MIVNDQIVGYRVMHGGLVAVLLQPCIEVACHAPMAQGIGAVSRDVNLDEPVALQMVVFCSRRAHHSVVRQYDDASM